MQPFADSSPPPIRTVVACSTALERTLVREMCETAGDLLMVGECASGVALREMCADTAPDLVVFDHSLRQADSYLTAHEGAATRPVMILVSDARDAASVAFAHEVADLVQKPIMRPRLHVALDRARRAVALRRMLAQHATFLEVLGVTRPQSAPSPATPATPADGRPRVLVVRSRWRHVVLPIESVEWIESDGNYVRVYAGGEIYLHRETMGQLEQRLAHWRFVRVHRYSLVNVDQIAEVCSDDDGARWLTTRGGKRLRMSRTYSGHVMRDVVMQLPGRVAKRAP